MEGKEASVLLLRRGEPQGSERWAARRRRTAPRCALLGDPLLVELASAAQASVAVEAA